MRLALVARPGVTATGTTTIGSAVVTLADTSPLVGALSVSGAGIPPGTFAETIDSSSQITLTKPATASASTPLAFAMEPVTLAEARLHLKDILPEENSLVAGLISAARQRCELELKRSFLNTTWDLFLDCFPRGCGEITIPRPPLIEVDSVNYRDLAGDEHAVDPAGYLVSVGTPARIAPAYLAQWPIAQKRLDAVRVRFAAGYGDTAQSVPECVKIAMLLLVSHLYENRGEADSNLPSTVTALLSAEDWGSYS